MRQHKYRGLNTKGEMVYGSLVITTHGIPNMPKTHTKTWIVESAFGNGGWFNVTRKQYVRPETAGQFTGLQDRNGADIYEGDIYHQGDTRILYEVVFSDDHLGFVGKQLGSGSLAGLRYFQSAIVVVGSIHQNPELLES